MPGVLRKIEALRRLQFQCSEIDQYFVNELIELESQHTKNIQPLLDKNKEIINGIYEPNETEIDIPLTYVEIPEKESHDPAEEKLVGIPGFWLFTLSNLPTFWSMINSYDIGPLSHLMDIRAETNPVKEFSLKIDFYFSPNEYFKNSVLTKKYIIRLVKEKKFKMNLNSTELINSIGCDIDWKTADLTLETDTRNAKKRSSFFNFFDPPKLMPKEFKEINRKIARHLLIDYKIGIDFKKIIPNAVQYFLGEAVLRENFGLENNFEIVDWSKFYGSLEEELFQREIVQKEKKNRIQNAPASEQYFKSPLEVVENSGHDESQLQETKLKPSLIINTAKESMKYIEGNEVDLSSENDECNDIGNIKREKKKQEMTEARLISQQVTAASTFKENNKAQKQPDGPTVKTRTAFAASSKQKREKPINNLSTTVNRKQKRFPASNRKTLNPPTVSFNKQPAKRDKPTVLATSSLRSEDNIASTVTHSIQQISSISANSKLVNNLPVEINKQPTEITASFGSKTVVTSSTLANKQSRASSSSLASNPKLISASSKQFSKRINPRIEREKINSHKY